MDAALRKTHRNVEELLDEKEMVTRRKLVHFCFLKRFSEVRKLTTFSLAKNDHRWVTFIFRKTINASRERLEVDLAGEMGKIQTVLRRSRGERPQAARSC